MPVSQHLLVPCETSLAYGVHPVPSSGSATAAIISFFSRGSFASSPRAAQSTLGTRIHPRGSLTCLLSASAAHRRFRPGHGYSRLRRRVPPVQPAAPFLPAVFVPFARIRERFSALRVACSTSTGGDTRDQITLSASRLWGSLSVPWLSSACVASWFVLPEDH